MPKENLITKMLKKNYSWPSKVVNRVEPVASFCDTPLECNHRFIIKCPKILTSLLERVLLVNITTTPIQCSAKEPSRAQKRFNTLSKGLQRDKALLQKWMQTHSLLKVELAQNVIPLSQEIDAMKLKMLTVLDKSYSNKALTVGQRKKLHTFVQYLVDICLCFDNSGVAEEIHDRYNDISVADINNATDAALKSELEDMFGVNLGEDFDFSSEGAYADFLGAVNDKKEQESSAQKNTKKRQAPPKKHKKNDNEVIESQSIKEVFRQLTKMLHPDREMDEDKKAKKSELMQRANIAYKQSDLFTLLELQFEIEKFEQTQLDDLANDKILAYNRMLQRQRKQIKEEINELKQRIIHEIDIPSFYDTPEDAFSYLDKEIINMNVSKSQLTEDMESLSDIKSLKRWLNAMKKSDMPTKDQEMTDAVMDDIFGF